MGICKVLLMTCADEIFELIAAMIARALNLQIHAKVSTKFADEVEIPQWEKGAVKAIRKLGIVSGRRGNRFVPNDM